MQQIRARIHHGFDGAEFFAAAAFNHVAGERERAAGETDEWNAAVKGFTDGSYGIKDVLQFFHVGNLQFGDIRFMLQGAFKFGAFAFGKVQAQTHGIGNG